MSLMALKSVRVFAAGILTLGGVLYLGNSYFSPGPQVSKRDERKKVAEHNDGFREIMPLYSWKPGQEEEPKRSGNPIETESDQVRINGISKKISISEPVRLQEKIVHFDLKGAPLRVSYFKKVFPLIKEAGATGVLLEYEDMFPYSGSYSVLRNGYAYSTEDIQAILRSAIKNNLKVIPLVQTLGHMEWVLKHTEFQDIREIFRYPQVTCPSKPKSLQVLKGILDNVMKIHSPFGVKTIHIGADEAYGLGTECQACNARLKTESKHDLMLQHVSTLATYLRDEHKVTRVLMWHDMLIKATDKTLRKYSLGDLIEPVIWKYWEDVRVPEAFPRDFFPRFLSAFPQVWAGSAFKGANGPDRTFINVSRYWSNHLSWLSLISELGEKRKQQFRGVILTGWQRFDHFAALCELFPEGIPSLVLNLQLLSKGMPKPSVKARTEQLLRCSEDKEARAEYVETVANLTKEMKRREVPLDPAVLDLPLGLIDCEFPGSQIYFLMRRLLILQQRFRLLEEANWKRGWLGPYNLKHRYSNVFRAEMYIKEGDELVKNFTTLGQQFREAMSNVFFDETLNEWLYANLQVYVDFIRETERAALEIRQTISFRNRPLDRDKLSF